MITFYRAFVPFKTLDAERAKELLDDFDLEYYFFAEHIDRICRHDKLSLHQIDIVDQAYRSILSKISVMLYEETKYNLFSDFGEPIKVINNYLDTHYGNTTEVIKYFKGEGKDLLHQEIYKKFFNLL